MSKEQRNINLNHIIVAATVLFCIFEVIVASGYIELESVEGLFSNLREGGDRWYANPIPWVIILVLVVNFLGFMENYSVSKEAYDKKKFAETWFKYLPLFLIFSQLPWATLLGVEDTVHVNMGITAAITLAVDVVTRALGKIGNHAPSLPPPIPATIQFDKVLSNVVVTVDGKAYPESPENGCKVGHFKVLTTEAKTTIVIAFADYNVHFVNIVADGRTVYNASLQYAQIKEAQS